MFGESFAFGSNYKRGKSHRVISRIERTLAFFRTPETRAHFECTARLTTRPRADNCVVKVCRSPGRRNNDTIHRGWTMRLLKTARTQPSAYVPSKRGRIALVEELETAKPLRGSRRGGLPPVLVASCGTRILLRSIGGPGAESTRVTQAGSLLSAFAF